jgi:hypothetical protein
MMIFFRIPILFITRLHLPAQYKITAAQACMFGSTATHAAQPSYTDRAQAFIGGLLPLCAGHHKSFFGITPPVT